MRKTVDVTGCRQAVRVVPRPVYTSLISLGASVIGMQTYSVVVLMAIEYLKGLICYSFFRLTRAILRFGGFSSKAIGFLHQMRGLVTRIRTLVLFVSYFKEIHEQ